MDDYLGRHRWTPVPPEIGSSDGDVRRLAVVGALGEPAVVWEALTPPSSPAAATIRALQQLGRRTGARGWLVPVLDQGVTVDGRPWVALPGGRPTLRSWLAEDRPPVEERLHALHLATQALLHLHASTAVPHERVTPDLFLVDPGPPLAVVLGDPGRAADETPATPGDFAPGYSPLEQRLGLPLDAAADTHALAVTLFEALTDELPAVVVHLELLLNARGRELRDLALRGPLPPDDAARHLALRRRGLEELLDGPEPEPLTPTDRARLVARLQDGVRGRVHNPESVARLAAEPLIDALTRALAVVPRSRDTSARRLGEACARARAVLEAALADGPTSSQGLRRAPAVRLLLPEEALPELTSTLLWGPAPDAHPPDEGADEITDEATTGGAPGDGAGDRTGDGAGDEGSDRTAAPPAHETGALTARTPLEGARPSSVDELDPASTSPGGSSEAPLRLPGASGVTDPRGPHAADGDTAPFVPVGPPSGWSPPPNAPRPASSSRAFPPQRGAHVAVSVTAPEPPTPLPWLATALTLGAVAAFVLLLGAALWWTHGLPPTPPSTVALPEVHASAPAAAPSPSSPGSPGEVTLLWTCTGDDDATFAIDGAPTVSRATRSTFAAGGHTVDMDCAGAIRRFHVRVADADGDVWLTIAGGGADLQRRVPAAARLAVSFDSTTERLAWLP